MRQFQCAPTTYVTAIKEIYFEIYTKQVPGPLALPLFNYLKLLISTKITCHYMANCLYLQDSYIHELIIC